MMVRETFCPEPSVSLACSVLPLLSLPPWCVILTHSLYPLLSSSPISGITYFQLSRFPLSHSLLSFSIFHSLSLSLSLLSCSLSVWRSFSVYFSSLSHLCFAVSLVLFLSHFLSLFLLSVSLPHFSFSSLSYLLLLLTCCLPPVQSCHQLPIAFSDCWNCTAPTLDKGFDSVLFKVIQLPQKWSSENHHPGPLRQRYGANSSAFAGPRGENRPEASKALTLASHQLCFWNIGKKK